MRIELFESEIAKLTITEVMVQIMNESTEGKALYADLDEDIKDTLKPPSWVKGYEAIWWAAVARALGDKDPDTFSGSKAYASATQIFKAYLKRATGYNIDQIKADAEKAGEKAKAGEIVKNAKKEMGQGMQAGSSSAASQVSKIGQLNKALSAIMQLSGKEFIDAIREKIYNKYLKK
jgi:hypothetical protein